MTSARTTTLTSATGSGRCDTTVRDGNDPLVRMPATPKILLISYHFPPDAAVGAVRPGKFAKYLSRLGWQPYILTVKEQYFAATDRGRLHEVSHLPTLRTRCWPAPLQLALSIKHRLRRNAPDGPQSAVSSGG